MAELPDKKSREETTGEEMQNKNDCTSDEFAVLNPDYEDKCDDDTTGLPTKPQPVRRTSIIKPSNLDGPCAPVPRRRISFVTSVGRLQVIRS